MTGDPNEILAGSRMSRLQIIAVLVTVGLNALDGFDIQAIGFAAPGIAREWHLANTALGIVLSMELIGMAAGSICLGGLADRLGRRPTVLGCLILMATGMLLATQATSVTDLSVYRVLTGVGIGGMLAATNAVVAEFSNARRQTLNVALMAIGYPIGAMIGGAIVARLLVGHGWRSVFYFGAAFTALLIPLVIAFVPESVCWLARRQPPGALQRINRTFARMGHTAITALPAIREDLHGRSLSDLFRPALLAVTLLVAVAYFFHIITFYFIIKWVPKLVTGMGFSAAAAAGVLVWANVGGATGGAALGVLSMRVPVKALTIAAMLLSTITVILFGRSPHDLLSLGLICACAGFATNAAIVGMYAIFAQAFPTHVRASGTGMAIGIGRGGSVLSPILAGFLLDRGYAVSSVALVMACGSLIAACVLTALKSGHGGAVASAKSVVAAV